MYTLYFLLKRIEKYYKEHDLHIPTFLKKLIINVDTFYNVFLVRYFKLQNSKKIGINSKQRKNRIIVSLTTYPARINTVWITIESLMRQSNKPDEIILWLARSQFDSLNSLPKSLINLKNRGLSIRFCDDLRSHKKYFYVMQEYAEDIVILVDDDMIYPKNLIKKLLKLHKKFPDDICTFSSQYMEGLLPSEWRNPFLKEKNWHSNNIQIFTGSGSLYPPNCLDKEVFNKKIITKLCPYADDLWLTFMALKKGTRISTLYPWHSFPISIYGTGKNSLWYINAEQGKNDEQWTNILKFYGEKTND